MEDATDKQEEFDTGSDMDEFLFDEDSLSYDFLDELIGDGGEHLRKVGEYDQPNFTDQRVLCQIPSDQYFWRKYGQKDVLGSKYPRSYYRCAFRHTQGCNATKRVQRSDGGNSFDVMYRGEHTCSVETQNALGSTSGASSMTQSIKKPEGMTEYSSVMGDPKETMSSISEIETTAKSSEIHNAGVNDQIRQAGSIMASTSALIESNKPLVLADMMRSVNERVKKASETKAAPVSPHLQRERELFDLLQLSPEHSSGSTDSILQKLFSAYQDLEVRKIGIFGNSGIGKTTVMRAFLWRYDLKRSYDMVLWVTIPKCLSRRKIQNALVQQLSLNVPNIMSEDEVAMILHQTLLARKFILFLDDVWKYIDLQKVGIPTDDLSDDYKIILVSRSIRICEAMNVDVIIEAEVLSKEESLKTFCNHLSHGISSDIETYARAIIDECCGLPLAIKVVGRALRKDQSILSWKRALKDILLADDLQILKIGYDKLEGVDMRSCFLYSALVTESKAVNISSLVEYFVDEGFVAGTTSDAHRRGHDIIQHLRDISLLECTDDGFLVEMHGLLRDLALAILSDVEGLQMLLNRYLKSLESRKTLLFHKNNLIFQQPESAESAKLSPSESRPFILRAGEGLREPPPQEEWEEAKMVFLMDNTLPSLPKRPTCSKLLLLFLQRNSCLRALPSTFFENMSSLQILNLSKTRIKSLPQSVSKLECLQVLILRNCERLIFLPSDIGALKHLLVLDVHGTEIYQLPDQIGELLCLLHLQVRFYGSMDQDEVTMLPSQLISKGIISKLIQLQELSIIVYPGDPRWTKIASDVTTEVSSLNLCSLSFHFPEISHLEFFINASPAWQHQTLACFNFIVGHDVTRLVSHVPDVLEHEYNLQDRCLRFVDGENIPDAIKKVLSQATSFYLDHHLTAQTLTQFGSHNISNLKLCIVRDCPKLNAIINSKKLTGTCFKVLETLSIHYSWNLKRIWVGPIRAGSCSMLRRLSVHSCPKLEFIMSPSMVALLPNLEELSVMDCQSLENVVTTEDQISAADDNGTDDSDFSEPNVADSNSFEDDAKDRMEVDPSEFAKLRIKVLKLHYLSKLVNIWNGGDLPCLEYVSLYNCPRLKNLNLKPHVELTLKEIKAETAWWEALEWEHPALRAILQDRVKPIQCADIWGTM